MPAGFTLGQLEKIVARDLAPLDKRILRCAAFNVDGVQVTKTMFKHLVLHANRPNFRVLVNFLRAPLFAEVPTSKWQRVFGLMGGHWSPLGGVTQDGHALIIDVNKSCVPPLLPLSRSLDFAPLSCDVWNGVGMHALPRCRAVMSRCHTLTLELCSASLCCVL